LQNFFKRPIYAAQVDKEKNDSKDQYHAPSMVCLRFAMPRGQARKPEKPARRPGGRESFVQKYLERNLSSEENPAPHSVGERGVSEPSSLSAQPGIFKEGVNAKEIGMIEGIEHGGMKFERRSLGELDLLEHPEIHNVRDGILGHVASRIAERRAK
jgi:hypothetical protein